MGLANPESLLDDPDEQDSHLGHPLADRCLAHRFLVRTTCGNRLPKGDPKLEKKFVQLAQSDPSGLVRLALASTLQCLPVSSRGEAGPSTWPDSGGCARTTCTGWFGMASPLWRSPIRRLSSCVARATEWKNLREWIARSLTDQAKERPEGLQALLSLMMEQPGKSDSLLLGMEEAFRGIKKVEAPENWSRLRAKLGKRPAVLRLSALFGDGSVLDDFADLAGDARADPQVRRGALQALIDAEAAGLEKLCMDLIEDKELNLLAARGLARSRS